MRPVLVDRPILTLVPCSDKAVAVGAVSFYVDYFVTGRIAKFTYGVSCNALYRPFDPEHVKREDKSWLDAVGQKWIPNCFEIMLSRVCHSSSFVDHHKRFHCAIGN